MATTIHTSRLWLREFLAEFFGTMFLVLVGDAAVAQMQIRTNLLGQSADLLSVHLAYGLAAAFAVYICGEASGGHINPAVTLTMCLFGRLKWYKMPIYFAAQYLGAFVGSAILYFVYYDSIHALNALVDKGGNALVYTPGIFATYPMTQINLFPAFLDQIVGTAILLAVVFALTDPRNAAVPKYMSPLLVGLLVCVIGMSYGIQCGYAINPARDFAPRFFTFILHGADVFEKGNNFFTYYFWIPIIAPHVGAIIGAFLYQAFVGAHWPIVYSDDHRRGSLKSLVITTEPAPLSPTFPPPPLKSKVDADIRFRKKSLQQF